DHTDFTGFQIIGFDDVVNLNLLRFQRGARGVFIRIAGEDVGKLAGIVELSGQVDIPGVGHAAQVEHIGGVEGIARGAATQKCHAHYQQESKNGSAKGREQVCLAAQVAPQFVGENAQHATTHRAISCAVTAMRGALRMARQISRGVGRLPYSSSDQRNTRADAHTTTSVISTSSAMLTTSCHCGTEPKPRRSMTAVGAVTGMSVSTTGIVPFGSVMKLKIKMTGTMLRKPKKPATCRLRSEERRVGN